MSTAFAPESQEAVITWNPTLAQVYESKMADFARYSEIAFDRQLPDFRALLDWSVTEVEEFWRSIQTYFDVLGEGFETAEVLEDSVMPFASWFPGAKLNFAENVLRHALNPLTADETAIYQVEEDGSHSVLTWAQLESQVAALSATFRELGVERGDRIAAVLPNVPEAVIGLLAAASIGAVWTINSPDLSAEASIRRVKQLEPKVLVASDGYIFGGKAIDRRAHTSEVEAGLPSITATVLVRILDTQREPGTMAVKEVERLAFDRCVEK